MVTRWSSLSGICEPRSKATDIKAIALWPSEITSLSLGSDSALPPRGCTIVSSCAASKVAIGWEVPASASITSIRLSEMGMGMKLVKCNSYIR